MAILQNQNIQFPQSHVWTFGHFHDSAVPELPCKVQGDTRALQEEHS